jgi:hypothetical protein
LLCTQDAAGKAASLPVLVLVLWEWFLHVLVRGVNDGYCKVTHGVPLATTFDTELLLDVNVVVVTNFDPCMGKHDLVAPRVHTDENYRFAL